MKFISTDIEDVRIIELDKKPDARGFFARTFCVDELKKWGIVFPVVQCNTTYNIKKGTVRGMHYQSSPYEESKIVRCTNGALYDVILNLRKESVSYGDWVWVYLSDKNFRAVYIPKGCAHGYQTLHPNTVVSYMVTTPYSPEHARTASYKKYNIHWPLPVSAISERDESA